MTRSLAASPNTMAPSRPFPSGSASSNADVALSYQSIRADAWAAGCRIGAAVHTSTDTSSRTRAPRARRSRSFHRRMSALRRANLSTAGACREPRAESLLSFGREAPWTSPHPPSTVAASSSGACSSGRAWRRFRPSGSRRSRPRQPTAGAIQAATRIVRAGCPSHNCGGRCLLTLHVENGVIVRIETDDRPTDTRRGAATARLHPRPRLPPPPVPSRPPAPPAEARRASAARASSSRSRGTRRSTRSRRELQRVKKTYGNSALFVPYGTGSYSQTNGRQVAQRLLNLFGGSLGSYNNYSWAAWRRRPRPSTARPSPATSGRTG